MYTSWDQVSDLAASLGVLEDLALSHASDGGAIGAEIARLIQSRDFHALVHYNLDYSADWDVTQLIHCRQALGFYQKLEELEIGIDKTEAAYQTFVDTEARCASTNAFFRSLSQGSACALPGVALQMESARRKIKKILGRAPKISELSLRFGPGSTTTIKRSDANPTNKMGQGITCSYDLFSSGLHRSLLREFPEWTGALPTTQWKICEDGWLVELVDVTLADGVLEFVPKNARTYRSIMTQPTLNTLFQGGLGRWLKGCLKRAGIDIRDQSLNQRLARLGSLTGLLATLDLSSASDLIAYELVKFLLPADWFQLLCASRTGSYSYNGVVRRLEKFATMGDGCTFPLETLIFWALTASACDGDVQSVTAYGDDIICPTDRAGDVITFLHQCGFSVNMKKSYWTGRFRESCGCDYYMGINVRPFYQKDLVGPRTLFLLHNHYVRNLDPDRAAAVRMKIPLHLRIYGPDGYGDGHLLAEDWPVRRRKNHFSDGKGASSAFETFSLVGRREVTKYPGDYVSPLYSIYVRPSSDLESEPVLPLRAWRTYHRTFELVEWAKSLSPLPATLHTGSKNNPRPYWAVPGNEGYKRTLIYTLG